MSSQDARSAAQGYADNIRRALAGSLTPDEGDAALHDLMAEYDRVCEALRISYPATPVDCLLSDLESTWEELPPPWFVRRVSDFRDELEAERRGS